MQVCTLQQRHDEDIRTTTVGKKARLRTRHENNYYAPKLGFMLLSSDPKITYYAFKKIIISKIMPLILANNVTVLAH